MSRIGKKPVQIPENVKVEQDGSILKISGPKGEILYTVPKELSVAIGEGEVQVEKVAKTALAPKLYGLFARMISNAITGVTEGWSKTLVLIGTGYRAKVEGKSLVLALGYSHPVKFEAPVDITFGVQENKVTITGIDRHIVGQIAANIRAVRPPEPYQGKGVRYEFEHVRRKAGKSAKAGAK